MTFATRNGIVLALALPMIATLLGQAGHTEYHDFAERQQRGDGRRRHQLREDFLIYHDFRYGGR